MPSEAAAEVYELLPLVDFVPALSPRLRSPTHLSDIAEAFDRALYEPVAIFASTPPQHGKTNLIEHGIVHRLLADPTTRVGYASYSARYAQKRSREMRSLYQRAGGVIDKSAGSMADWRTGVESGGVWAGGVDGSWTGESLDLVVIDDPIKSRAEAESAIEQEKLIEWFLNDLESRMQMRSSLIVIHTRWTTKDLGSYLMKHPNRPYATVRPIVLPAIDASGKALCDWRYDIETLLKIKAEKGSYIWESLYQGRPFSKGGRVFEEAHIYEPGVIPDRLRIVCGCDLAYSKKTHADWSVLVILGVDDINEIAYVLHVIRRQESAPKFAMTMREALKDYKGAEVRWYYAGAELGIADFLKTLEVELDSQPAAADKHMRAQPVAAAWNAGRVLVPRGAQWLDDFVSEVVSFSGVSDVHDDQVDALAAAYDASVQPGWAKAMHRILEEKKTIVLPPRESKAKYLRAARDFAGITIDELAARTGREAYYLSMAEMGGMNVNDLFIKDILQACDLPSDWNPKTKP